MERPAGQVTIDAQTAALGRAALGASAAEVLASHLTCAEVQALADLLTALGAEQHLAEYWLSLHELRGGCDSCADYDGNDD
jgi:hypothetical protein